MSARTVEVGGRVLEVHRPFHESTARVKVAIGGLGSGKSRALCVEAIRFALAHPGSDMFLTRRFVPALNDSTRAMFMEVLPPELKAMCEVRKVDRSIRFPNGSLLKFRGMEDWKEHRSQNLAWIGIDEADEQSEENLIGIMTRLRQTEPLAGAPPLPSGAKMPNQVAMACNPAGQNWIWRNFVNPKSRWTDSSCHLSTPFDNPYLPQSYLDDLLSRPAPFVRRFVLVQFDAAAGRIYEDWSWNTHVIAEKEPGHFGRTIWMGMDPGAHRTAGLWCEVDHKNRRLVAVSEYEEGNTKIEDHAKAWRDLEAKMAPAQVRRRIGDPSMSKRDLASMTGADEQYRRLGFFFEPGPVRAENRIVGLQDAIAAGAFVCTTACPRLYEELMNARWEDQIPKYRDIDNEFQGKMAKGKEFHIHDCAQYVTSKWIVAPKEAPAPENTGRAMLDPYERERAARNSPAALHGKALRRELPEGVLLP